MKPTIGRIRKSAVPASTTQVPNAGAISAPSDSLLITMPANGTLPKTLTDERRAEMNGDFVLAVALARPGRVRFCHLDGSPAAAPNAASCLVAWDRSERRLLRELESGGKGKLAIL